MISSSDILKASVLIVDDQPANVSLLEQLLRGAGYLAVSSTTDPCGVCALHALNRYNLILLDLQMPVMDGFQVLDGLKEIEGGNDLPVLVITAQPNHKLRALKAGAKEFVSKPFDLAEVLVRVHNMLEVRLLQVSARRESEQWLGAIFDQAAVGVAQTDVDTGRFLRVNRRFCEIVGFTPGEMARLSTAEITHEQDVGMNAREVSLMRDGSLRELAQEARYVRKDGAVVWVSLALSSIGTPGNAPSSFIVVAQDITERKQAEREIRRQAAFAQFNPDPILELSAAGEVTYFNSAAAEMARSLGADTPDRILPENIQSIVGGCLSSSKTVRLETRARGRTISWLFFPVPATQVVHCTAGDVTERKHLEEHFLQAQKMEALGQFSGGVAHDFNNILMAISGYTELSQLALTENPTVRGFLASVLQATHRAADMVRQILTFSRQQPQERRAIRLQPVVAETLKLLRVTIPATIEFEVSVSEDAPAVFADANQIHQVLMNLGINASHAMKDLPGRLRVSLEQSVVDDPPRDGQPPVRPGAYAVMTFTDSGCGMDPATLARIFEPFFTTKAPGEGTGLGLAVVRSIMDGHGGAVTVESEPGKGTSFHLYFPEHSGLVAGAAAEDGPAPRGTGQRILVVDDEEILAELLQKELTALGYEVAFTTRPADAFARVASDPAWFDLVLTDQTMPGMSGLLLAGRLTGIRPGLPIVLMSGYTASLTSERLASAGVRQLLVKPSSIRSLGRAVHAAFSSGAATPGQLAGPAENVMA
jgi:PAS domain S-box-containing protein